MLNIENAIVPKLDKINIKFASAYGATDTDAKDNVNSFALQVGMVYPLIKISKTILNANDIMSFAMQTGFDCKLPIMEVAFNDELSQFRDSDFIGGTTPVRVWIGSTMSDEKPWNMQMKVTNVRTNYNTITLSGALDIPSEPLTIYAGSVQNMLQGFAEKSGFGIICNDEELLSQEIQKNFIDLTPYNFIHTFCQTLGVTDWFIDGKYTLQILNVKTAIEQHQDKVCYNVFESTDRLEEPQKVRYDNNNNTTTQFKFNKAGFNFVKTNIIKPEREAIIFDKSYKPDLNKYQVVEGDYVDNTKPEDMDTLYFEARVDPYKFPGNTFDIAVYTDPASPKRTDIDSYQEGQQKPIGQQLIADESGIYMLSNALFRFVQGRFTVRTDFERMPLETDNSEEGIATIGATPFKAKWKLTEIKPPKAPEGKEPDATNLPKGEQSRMAVCMHFLMNKGLTKAQAAGIVGNLYAESGLNTTAYNPGGGNIGAYGICQWRAGRQTRLKSLPNYNDINVQLGFLWTELVSNSSLGLAQLRSTTTIYDASYVFLVYFERPEVKEKGNSMHLTRVSYAKTAYASV